MNSTIGFPIVSLSIGLCKEPSSGSESWKKAYSAYEDKPDFLKAADHPKFFGLTGGTGETSNAVENFGMERTKERKEKVPKKEVAFDMRTPKIEGNFEAADDPPNEKLLVNSVFSPSKAADVEEKMRSMMERLREKSDYKWVCKVFFSFLLCPFLLIFSPQGLRPEDQGE